MACRTPSFSKIVETRAQILRACANEMLKSTACAIKKFPNINYTVLNHLLITHPSDKDKKERALFIESYWA